MRHRLCLLVFLSLILAIKIDADDLPSTAISLAGTWRFQLDREDVGMDQRWFDRALTHSIELPGALQNQGFGDDVGVDTRWTANVNDRTWYTAPQFEKYRQPGRIKVPFWLQPEKHYVGAAWYQRDIEIPASWQGRRVRLTLERPHWETRVWLDGQALGTQDSLSTPHVYDLGAGVPAGKHQLTIRVANRLMVDVGIWAHSVSDHTQGNWNGLVGQLELSSTPPVWIEDVQVFPNVKEKTAQLRVRLGNATGQSGKGRLLWEVGERHADRVKSWLRSEIPVQWGVDGGSAQVELALGKQAKLWDEFSPVLYEVRLWLIPSEPRAAARTSRVRFGGGVSTEATSQVTFGLREIRTTPDHLFAVNGRKTFLRGTLECCIFPLTGYPPTDPAAWRRILRICQEHGLNHMRFHSWCPPEAAFVAADEAGFYFQVEIAAWTTVGDGGAIDRWLYAEAERVLRQYGNHPSFILMPYGNEPGGKNHQAWLTAWVDHWKAQDPRRLYTSGSGWPMLETSQYHVTPGPRGPRGWVGGDYRAAISNLHAPVIVHEMGQWCVYPNFDEIAKYTGPLKARNFEIFRDSLAEHGLLDQWRAFLRASGKLQTLCYKEEIEAAFRTPGVSGIQLLDLHDFPGQGTALVGVLDAFWDPKGYVSAAEFRRFYDTTVPLARMAKRVWTTSETFHADLEAVHFGARPLPDVVTSWRLVDAQDGTVARGQLAAKTLPVDRGIPLGDLDLDLARLPAPAIYQFIVSLQPAGSMGQASRQPRSAPDYYANDWTIFVYPGRTQETSPDSVLVTSRLDMPSLARLTNGTKVLLLASRLSASHPRGSFTPVFWNRQWFPSQACQTLGLLCDPTHPALARFPTEFHSDWQWEDIVNHSRAVVMDSFPAALRPVVQVIDDWNTNRRLGLIFEGRVGAGQLLVCAADLENNLDNRPAARQLRASLLAYMNSAAFQPKTTLSPEVVSAVLSYVPASKLAGIGAKIIAVDSEDREHDHLAVHAIDGDPDTFWHTRWEPGPDPMPHQLIIDLGQERGLKAVTYLPRQDMDRGRIAQVEIYLSDNPNAWQAPAAVAQWENTDRRQTLNFVEPGKARYLKVLIKSEINGNPFASVAELDVVEP